MGTPGPTDRRPRRLSRPTNNAGLNVDNIQCNAINVTYCKTTSGKSPLIVEKIIIFHISMLNEKLQVNLFSHGK